MDLLELGIVIIAVFCAIQLPLAAGQASGGPYVVRVACGATKESYAPANGYLWSADFGYTGGSSANITVQDRIAPQLTTSRYFQLSDGPENCYNITVPNGHYLFRFFFAYGDEDNAGREPQFEVSLEGTLVYRFDQGWSTSIDNQYADSLLFVTDGAATACFHSSGHGNPTIVSFEILQVYDDAYDRGPNASLNVIFRTVKRVSAGAPSSGYGSDFHADTWGGDRYWSTDSTLFIPGSVMSVIQTTENITNYSVPPNVYPQAIYQSATTTDSSRSLSYTVPVEANHNYSIWLHLAEISSTVTGVGERIFDVLANGQPIFPKVDIIQLAGGNFSALILNQTVLVESRTLTLTFNPVRGSIAVNAFEVYQVIPTEFSTSDSNIWSLQKLKLSLNLPPRLGWNGDPCVPQEHPWYGVNCGFDPTNGAWFIDGLDLDYQGLQGYLSADISSLSNLQSLNLSNNRLQGPIPPSIGNLSSLITLDLSRNLLNGSIPASLGQLSHLQQLYLNENQLSGEVPAALGAFPIRGAILNLAGNIGLCGPGLQSCSTLSNGAKVGVAIASITGLFLLIICGICYWKRRKNIARAQRLPRDAPYAKARTTFVRDVQLAKTVLANHFRPAYSEQIPTNVI